MSCISHPNDVGASLGRGCDSPAHRRVRIVLSVARLGSALTVFIARAICELSGAREEDSAAHNGDGAINRNGVTNSSTTTASDRKALFRESTPQFLLDVPCFELRTPVEIHRESS